MAERQPRANEGRRHILDASGAILGRLASEVASLLRGKGKVSFVPYLDAGDEVIVFNAEKVVLTGRKERQKLYRRHSGKPGHLKALAAYEVRARDPSKLIINAVRGMLPANKLRRRWLSRLKVFAGKLPDALAK